MDITTVCRTFVNILQFQRLELLEMHITIVTLKYQCILNRLQGCIVSYTFRIVEYK